MGAPFAYDVLILGGWPSELLDGRDGPDSHDWRDDLGELSVARVIVGCSAHNLCFWIHPAAGDWDEWVAASGDPGWSAASMSSQIDRVEAAMELRRFSGDEVNPWLRTCIDAAAEIGLGALEDVNDHRHDTGLGPMPLNAAGTTRWNAAFAYLDPARSRPNLTILADSMVERVELSGDRAVGAHVYREGSRTLRVVGRADAQRDRPGGGARAARDPRRRGPASRSMAARPLQRRAAVGAERSQGIARARSSQVGDGPWDLHLMVGLVPAIDGGFPERSGHVLGLNVALVKPDWTGTVTLRSADPAHLPIVTAQNLDMTAMLDGIDLCAELTRSRAARGAWEQQLIPEPELSGTRLREHCAGHVRPYFHPVGTCPMGRPGDERSVVDATGKVHGFRNLHVADASIMPTIPRANTNLRSSRPPNGSLSCSARWTDRAAPEPHAAFPHRPVPARRLDAAFANGSREPRRELADAAA